MKYLFIILVLAYSSLYSSDYEWKFTHLNNDTVQTAGHSRVSCLDSITAVASKTNTSLPYSRLITHTNDYGQTWDTVYYEDMDISFTELFEQAIMNVKYLDKNNIIAITGYNNFLQSTDGGNAWVDTCYFDDSFAFSNISCFDSLVFVGGLSDRFIGISTDIGHTWSIKEININLDKQQQYEDTIIYTPNMFNDTLYALVHLRRKVPFLSQLNFFTDNLFLISTDKGESWVKSFKIDSMELSKCYAIDDKYFYTQSLEYSFEKILLKNPNGGDPDTAYTPTPHRQILKIDKFSGEIDILTDSLSFTFGSIIEFNKFSNYLCISTLYNSFYSSDYGTTWIEENWNSLGKNASIINDYERLSMSKGFLVGNSKFATLQPITSVLQKQNAIQNISVYPNPISSGSKLNLEFEAQGSGVYSYKLSSLDGRSMQIDSQDYLSTGKAFTAIELGNDFATGVYILSIMKDGEVVAAKKVILE